MIGLEWLGIGYVAGVVSSLTGVVLVARKIVRRFKL